MYDKTLLQFNPDELRRVTKKLIEVNGGCHHFLTRAEAHALQTWDRSTVVWRPGRTVEEICRINLLRNARARALLKLLAHDDGFGTIKPQELGIIHEALTALVHKMSVDAYEAGERFHDWPEALRGDTGELWGNSERGARLRA